MSEQGSCALRRIACNYAEATYLARRGAACFVLMDNQGNGNDRIRLLVRTRGGRIVQKWERMGRLTNFRSLTIPPEHPCYLDLKTAPGEEKLDELRLAAEFWRGEPKQ